MNKKITYFAIVIFVSLIVLLLSKIFVFNLLLKHKAENKFSIHGLEMLHDGKVHVITIGTGSPEPDLKIAQSCTGIICNGEFIILDAGSGSARKAEALGLPVKNLTGIFISHFHSDHILDIAAWTNISWVAGRHDSLFVFGFPGIDDIVNGFNQTLTLDAQYRYENIKSTATGFAYGIPRIYPTPVGNSMPLIYSSPKGMKIFAFNVSHEPVSPAVGYRIEVGGKVIVYSGDTKKDDRMIVHAHNADLLIHESYSKSFMLQALQYGETLDPQKQDKYLFEQAKSTSRYHCDPKEAAAIAESAGVKRLVYTHIIPSVGTGMKRFFLKNYYLKGVKHIYHGQVDLAEDGMQISL